MDWKTFATAIMVAPLALLIAAFTVHETRAAIRVARALDRRRAKR